MPKKGLDNLLLAQKLSHYPLAQKRKKPFTNLLLRIPHTSSFHLRHQFKAPTIVYPFEESGTILLLWTTFYEN
jgi:hypothetical protein